MKAVAGTVATVALAVVAACAPATNQREAPAPRFTGSGVAEQFRKMEGLTALDVVKTMPGYMSRAMQAPAQRFTLVLDGKYDADFEFLKTICARDLYDVRIVPAHETIATSSGAEIVVTTIAGRRRTR